MSTTTIDTRKFEAALKESLLRTRRDFALVINSAAIEVITTAAKLTPKADKSEIMFKLMSAATPAASAGSKRTVAGLSQSATRHRMKILNKPPLLLYLILNARQKKQFGWGHGLNNIDMSMAGQKFMKQRMASVGFTSYAGWQKALLAVGGRGFGAGRKKPGFGASSADAGKGKPATIAELMTKFSNTATWIEHIGREPVQAALDKSAAKMTRHLEEKLLGHCRAATR